MTLRELSDHVVVVPGGVNIGVIRGDGNRCVLIDTGLHDSAAKKALRAVQDELGGQVVAVLTTHAHADHFGGNATVVKRTGAKVHAPAIDEAFLRYPLLQPVSLFAGADPLDTLRIKFLLAESSPVDAILEPGPMTIEGIDIEVIPLAGHSPNQVGILVDGVFFCADVVLPEQILAKYRIPYLFSVRDHLASLARCADWPCHAVVPGHGPVLESLAPLRDQNRALVLEVAERIVDFAGSGTTAEDLLARLLRYYQADVADAPSYYLLHPTIYAFLSALHAEGRIRHDVRDGASIWTATG